jgi:hypothetical protein
MTSRTLALVSFPVLLLTLLAGCDTTVEVTGEAAGSAGGFVKVADTPCLTNGNTIIKHPPGKYTKAISYEDPKSDTTLDLRDAVVFAYPDADLLRISRAPANVCIVGVKVVGDMPRDWGWGKIKHELPLDNAGIAFRRARSGMHTIERSWVENVEDGILMPRGVDNPGDAKLTLRSSYVRYIRDDSIEADGCFHNVIDDVLVDDGHMMFAARPSAGVKIPASREGSWKVRNSLLHIGCKPDERDKAGRSGCPDRTEGPVLTQSTGGFFKKSACFGRVDMADTILRADARPASGITNIDFPPGTYRNVVMVWTGPGDFPGQLPASGVIVTKDVSVWTEARAEWLRRHGCDPVPNDCAFLHE